MEQKIAIEAFQLGKCYQVYKKPVDRLKQSLWRGRKRFHDEFWALRNTTFQVKRGETVGIIGSNGSGKSTLLRLMCGILRPTTGGISVNGRITALLELGAGFNPEFTGRENVFMSAALMGLNRAETEKRFPEIEAFAGIGRFIEQPVKTYSSGMYVRLAFSVAVHMSPEILLIDEALSVGDIRFQQKCMARIKSFCAAGTVVFVSHNTAAVVELCSRVLWVEKGRVRMDGNPKEVVKAYTRYMYEGEVLEMTLPKPVSSVQTTTVEGTRWEGFRKIGEGFSAFGDRRAVIDRIQLISEDGTEAMARSGEAFRFNMLVFVHERIERPIVGYILKDRMGREVFGDNSRLMKVPMAPMEMNGRYIVSFLFAAWPNILAGKYTLSLAVSDGNGEHHVPCHWYQDVAVIESIPVRPPAGIFSPLDTSVTVVDLSAEMLFTEKGAVPF